MDGPGFYRCLSPGQQLAAHGTQVIMPKRDLTETEIPYLDLQGRPCLWPNGDRVIQKIHKRWIFDVNFRLPDSADLYVWQQWKERVLVESGLSQIRANGSALAMEVDDNYVNVPEYNPAFYGAHPYRKSDGAILNRDARRKVRMPQGRSKLSYQQRVLLKQKGQAPAPPNSHNYKHMLNAMRCVDLVTVSTPFLAEVYAPYNSNIHVVRNYVDWDMWEDITPQYEVERERLRVGFLAQFIYRKGDLDVIKRVIPDFLKAHPEVDFVATDEATHNYLGVPLDQRVTIGRYDFYDVENGTFPMPEKTAVMDIGLVPLAMNDMNQGKSHLKGMEYNAAGIPFIASPTESYKDYWCDGSNGVIATNDKEWRMYLETLVENDGLRRYAGECGRKKARAHSIQQNWREWHSVYAKLLGDEHYATARRAIAVGAVQKHSELGPLLQLVAQARPRTIVEIGTARGGTFWAIAQTAPDDALLVSMDIPAGSPLDVNSGGEDVYTGRGERKKLKDLIKPTQGLRLIDMNTQLPQAKGALAHALNGRMVDLLFIDGDHRYEGVKHDFDTYSQFVAPGGIVAFHDIVTHYDKRVGVSKFWDEIKMQYEYEEFVGPETWGYTPWGGIGVLYL
jgi:glycosyltransferase involved in cell wall biosynthesis